MRLSQKIIAQLAELNRARADYRLVERMTRLESVEEFFYQRLKQLTQRVEELERALLHSKNGRPHPGQDRLRDVPATRPDLWKGDGT